METNVNKSHEKQANPFAGIQIFTYKGDVYCLENGTSKPFHEMPEAFKKAFRQAYRKDINQYNLLQNAWAYDGFVDGFAKWVYCYFTLRDGHIDTDPGTGDIVLLKSEGCKDTECQLRGVLCHIPKKKAKLHQPDINFPNDQI